MIETINPSMANSETPQMSACASEQGIQQRVWCQSGSQLCWAAKWWGERRRLKTPQITAAGDNEVAPLSRDYTLMETTK